MQAFSGRNGSLGSGGHRRLCEKSAVILFDNAGVASSSGQTPDTIDAMASTPPIHRGAWTFAD